MHIAGGRLIRLLADWRPPFSGYHLYCPAAGRTLQHSPLNKKGAAGRTGPRLQTAVSQPFVRGGCGRDLLL
jgi:hypothetical protein